MFVAEWRWSGVWHSFPFLAWDRSMHPRTKIWFFNQFICTGACACSSNLKRRRTAWLEWFWYSARRCRHRGSPANVDVLAFVILVNPKFVWNSWNLACYHGAASTYCGKKIVPFGAGSGVRFSRTRASHNKHDGFGREHPTFGDKTISIASYCFQNSGVLCQFLWFFGVLLDILCINWFFNAFMCIIQIWTTCTCSSAYKLVEKSNLCPWVHA